MVDTRARAVADRPRKKIRVVVVDDHPIFRKGLVDLINDEPDMHVSGEAETAATALRVVTLHRPDVAVVDLSLGSESGIDLVAAMAADHPAVRVLVLSGHDEILYADRALKAGALGYVMKDCPGREVLTMLRRVAGGQTCVSAAAAQRILSSLHPSGGRDERSAFDRLSNRERHVLTLIGRGMTTRQIGDQLKLSVKTIETHCARLKQKLGAANSRELLRLAVSWAERIPR